MTSLSEQELANIIAGLEAPQAAAPVQVAVPAAVAAPAAPVATAQPAVIAPAAPPAPAAPAAPAAPVIASGTMTVNVAALTGAAMAAPAAPTYAAPPSFADQVAQKKEAEANAGANAATKALELKTFIDPEQVRADVAFNPTDLDAAIIQHAAKFAYYAEQGVQARRQFERVKAAVEVLETQLDAYYRKKLADEGAKVTEKMVESAVKMDSRWLAAQYRLADAKAIQGSCESVAESLRQRKDMLVQTSVDRRIEREGELRVQSAAASNVTRGAAALAAVAAAS
ncbi:hypothetical protein [Cupriavidus metallidurans]|uniref:hypothetical protein n=1 Tax=Cupriavidus metallidurans TaxID=119219 RepID=UPI001CC9790A|nr:hypothetical protein [Cupriavidus metallidurans]UBM12719.1 hypothetical protein LAI70_28310 [Cupriavidus metallidurans]